MVQISYEGLFWIIFFVLGGYGVVIHQYMRKRTEFEMLWSVHYRVLEEREVLKIRLKRLQDSEQ